MTTLDQTVTDRTPTVTDRPPTGAPARPAGVRGLTSAAAAAGSSTSVGSAGPDSAVVGPGASRCSIAAAGAEGLTGGTIGAAGGADGVGGPVGGALRGGSVPRPRSGDADDGPGAGVVQGIVQGVVQGGGRGGGRGSGESDGQAARQADGSAGGRADGRVGGEGFVRLQQPLVPEDRTVPVLRASQEEPRTVLARRPAPSRRLRRMHPQAAPAGGRSKTVRAQPTPGTDPAAVPHTGPSTGPNAVDDPAGAAPPLGILISGSPTPPEPAPHLAERPAVRTAAELIRPGRGTCLVVLPAWRPAIAVSVPTEQLLSATGLAFEGLAEAQLSVVINPDALHDRELELRDWQAGPAGRPGRRGGRRAG
ncbi:hypothetical protein [Kitasatospora sp. NPDC093806]|uniref:hypothetical protein n=1 Tax=Kitasatospora sp. NPDC093806 TaxID=3155075 RepID=UPI0034237B87